MSPRPKVTIDGNEAAAHVAYRTSEVIAIYPITPATPMGEFADQWSASGAKNIWGGTPRVIEMQSEAGAAGTVHGALQTGSLSTTFTASQGLLLMIPNMYKIAGELTSTVFHIAARSLAAQGLSIFGDHQDVMAVRQTGWAMLFSNSVQECMDLALVSTAATLEARVPFLHCFDGFRTSHEIQKVEQLTDDDIRAMIPQELINAHRARGLSPDRPFIRGTAQNPDTYFQGREAANPYYNATPAIVQNTMDHFAQLTGRQYKLVEYLGAADAERVIVAMGSACETLEETIENLNSRGERVGLIKIRLYRPFPAEALWAAIPPTVKKIAVLDRTKEPGSQGEPLYLDVVTACLEGAVTGQLNCPEMPRIVGGRYGLSSKEFTPAMALAVLNNLREDRPKNHFTVGIKDDVTHTSLSMPDDYWLDHPGMKRAIFWGLGSDGTVGANKNSIKILGDATDYFCQGYFVYDSKKAGARTISHLRFGPNPIRSPYLIEHANFIAVHQFGFLEVYRPLKDALPGAVFLLNSPYPLEETWSKLPRQVQETIIHKQLDVYVIDAYRVAKENGMGNRINTVMQTCFFAISGILPQDEAITRIKEAINKTYGKRGEAIVKMNYAAVDAAVAHLHRLPIPAQISSDIEMRDAVPAHAPEFVRHVTAPMLLGLGDDLPVSALPADGTYPSATTQYEKRNIAQEIPVWEPDLCIQCGKCVMVCPHSVIRGKVYSQELLEDAPGTFKSLDGKFREMPGKRFTIQVAPEDCTGCTLCVEICPAKDKSNVSRKALNMADRIPLRQTEAENWEFFLRLPDIHPSTGDMPDPVRDANGTVDEKKRLKFDNVKNVMLLQPTFEFSSACAGCGETPYLRLLSQLFGNRIYIANATGCSSIYGGNLPTTPWSTDKHGRGPAWSNSLFEDNGEFGLGMRLTLETQHEYARSLVRDLRAYIGDDLTDALLNSSQIEEGDVASQRERVVELKEKLSSINGDSDPVKVADLKALADQLVRKSVWIVGGDGWAYDIGFGGLDHVMASGMNVNVLILDTEVYSNTGGQASKSTAIGAVAKFASGGKASPKKDFGLLAMSYGHVYVAQVAMGANDNQTLRAFREAESYDGTSIIIAYSHCIAHGIDMAKGMDQQRLATATGHWPLFRYDPRRRAEGLNPLQLDSKKPKIPLKDYINNENRYRVLQKIDPEAAARFGRLAQENVNQHWRELETIAGLSAQDTPIT